MTFTIQPAHMNAALMHVQYIAYTKIHDTKKTWIICYVTILVIFLSNNTGELQAILLRREEKKYKEKPTSLYSQRHQCKISDFDF